MRLKELKRQVAMEEAKVAKENERKTLKRKLFVLRHRKVIRVIKATGTGAKRVGRGLNRITQIAVSAAQKAEKKTKKKQKGNGLNFNMPDYSGFAS